METLDDYFEKMQNLSVPITHICLIEISNYTYFDTTITSTRFINQTIPNEFIHEISNKFNFSWDKLSRLFKTNNDIILQITL